MIQKFVEMNKHKVLGVTIIEEPVFTCQFHQIFVENMEEFKQGHPDKDDSQVIFGANWQEFCVIVSEIMPYWEKLQKVGQLMEQLSSSDKAIK
jgi:hypothetical protein